LRKGYSPQPPSSVERFGKSRHQDARRLRGSQGRLGDNEAHTLEISIFTFLPNAAATLVRTMASSIRRMSPFTGEPKQIMSNQIIDQQLGGLKQSFAGILLKLQDLAKQRKMGRNFSSCRRLCHDETTRISLWWSARSNQARAVLLTLFLAKGCVRLMRDLAQTRFQEIVFGEEEHVELRGKYLTRISRRSNS